jgi:hypothetical protein
MNDHHAAAIRVDDDLNLPDNPTGDYLLLRLYSLRGMRGHLMAEHRILIKEETIRNANITERARIEIFDLECSGNVLENQYRIEGCATEAEARWVEPDLEWFRRKMAENTLVNDLDKAASAVANREMERIVRELAVINRKMQQLDALLIARYG